MSGTDRAISIEQCDTLMFDMDGTLLDLAFDNFMWLERIPSAYAEKHGLSPAAALDTLMTHYRQLQGQLEWYCLDHWRERLDIDVLALHEEEHARIGWLPGAEKLLQALNGRGKRVLLVTNAHPDTLRLKSAVTRITGYFDAVYSSHNFGQPKESQAFWAALAAAEDFDVARTLFVDDSEAVLHSACEYGVRKLVAITEPDSSRPRTSGSAFTELARAADLLAQDTRPDYS